MGIREYTSVSKMFVNSSSQPADEPIGLELLHAFVILVLALLLVSDLKVIKLFCWKGWQFICSLGISMVIRWLHLLGSDFLGVIRFLSWR